MVSLIPSPNRLLVEGATEKRLIPELIKQQGVQWERQDGTHAVDITSYGGIDNMLAPGEFETALKTSSLEALGVLFDSDGLHGEQKDRWSAMRKRCFEVGFELPEVPLAGGFIIHQKALRFGVWMMPDNVDAGMLETFLLRLILNSSDPLFQHASGSVEKASELGAPYRLPHKHKALIHTWLSWQDAPGAQLHEAVKFKLLDSRAPSAKSFVRWFRELFNCEGIFPPRSQRAELAPVW